MSLELRCPICGGTVSSQDEYCRYCKSPLKPGKALQERSSIQTTAENLSRRVGTHVRAELRQELEREFGKPTSEKALAEPAVQYKAVSLDLEEYSTSELSIVRRNGDYEVEFRSGRKAATDVVQTQPLKASIKASTIRQLEKAYFDFHQENDKDRNDLLAYGRLLTESFPDQILREIFELLSPGSRLLLRIDESALGIPWELLGREDRMVATRYSTGKIVVSNEQAHTNIRGRVGSREKTRILVADFAYHQDPETQRVQGFGGLSSVIDDLVDELQYKETVQIERIGVPRIGISGRSVRSKDELLRELANGDYDVVIFSAHGIYYAEQGVRLTSYQIITDQDGLGFVTAPEIDSAYQNSRLPPPLLWVSSSCQTASQQGWNRDLARLPVRLSLAATLNLHNVPFVGPYWDTVGGLSDRRGGDIVLETFFRRIFSSPPSPLGDALLAGKREVLKSGLDWANYTLYGSPSLRIVAS